MLKSAILYRLSPDWKPPARDAFEEALERERFQPCRATEPRSAGWVEPRGTAHAALLESIDGQLIVSLRTETRAVPASAVKAALDERLQRVEDDTGSRPRGKRRKELKEEVVVDLLPRAFSKFSTTRIWIDPDARLMVVGAGSVARADEAVGLLMQCLRAIDNPFAATPVNTAIAPSTGMSLWLSEREAPAGFGIDRECELQQAQRVPAGGQAQGDEGPTAAQQAAESRATVRYARHDLELDEIVAHIAQGKVATRLAMTWRDRVSFVLDSSLCLKRIELLDVVLEATGSQGEPGGDDDGFDADVAIMTAELGRLVPELIEALGGERPDTAGAPAGNSDASAAAKPEAMQTA